MTRAFSFLFLGLISVFAGLCDLSAKPNVLFIAIDDLNDYVSPLDNHPGVKTPHFERLAKRSVNFANAHCAAPACHPSRVAVMTGVHPSRSGIYRNMFGAHGPRWRHESALLENAVVLSRHFGNHGYHAAGGGKIFHTLQWTPGDSQNDPDAWDEHRGDPLDPISSDWPRPKFTQGDNVGFVGRRPLGNYLFGAAPLEQPEESYGDHLVVDWAIEKLKEKRQKPLFLAVGLFRPHIPWEVGRKWFDLYPMDEVKLPVHQADDLQDARDHGRRGWHRWVTENKQWKDLMQGYLASISYVDHQLGRLLDGLDRSGLRENTVVVLWSDHGFHIGEKENWEKFALWDQTTRVPLFIHAPGLSKDGEKTRQPVTLTDLYPTLCELAGLPIPVQCDGVSLVPQLKNPVKKKTTLSLTSFQFGGDSKPSHGVSDDRYRFIRYGNGFEELYDLEEDPHEFVNLAKEPKFAKVREKLARGVPSDAAKIAVIPKDSPHHRGRARAPKTFKVFLLAGQSNMQGQGVVDMDHPKYYNGGKGTLLRVMKNAADPRRYAHLKDAKGNWITRNDAFIRYRNKQGVMAGGVSIGFTGYGSMKSRHHIGPELQIGHRLGDHLKEPVLLIKTAWGGKSLYEDFRPPSAGGETGEYYGKMLAEVDEALKNYRKEFPSLKGSKPEWGGFVWFQGWNDMFNQEALAQYEQNLVHLIKDLRVHLKQPNLPVVVGELGNMGEDAGKNMKTIREAQRKASERKEWKGRVSFVQTTDFARPKEESPNVGHGHHWFGNAESYFLIGDALGAEMVRLLKDKK